MKLLLIVDNVLEQDLFLLALKRIKSDVEFYSVSTCDEALTRLLHRTIPAPDYIVLDTDMPILDANSCLSMLKNSTDLSLTSIILYSQSVNSADIRYMLRNGAQSHLFKSRSFTLFCDELKYLLAEA